MKIVLGKKIQKNAKVLFKAMAVLAVACLCACVEDDVARGNKALRIGDYNRAIVNFNKALDQDPAHRDARYGLALSYYALAESEERLNVSSFDLWERASREFDILSKVDSSGQIDANYSTCLFYLARAMMQAGNSDVLSMLDKSIRLDSLNFFSYNLKALLLAGLGRSDDAKNIFVYIVTKEPKFSSAYLNLGNIYWGEGDIESAWDIWSMGHEALPKDAALEHWTKVAEDSLKAKVLSEGL
ncbi:MAG: tetratricopeptide repeat protein [Fibrobacter sp.]|nr:tetratricopeptide repeat protein [Fibrobacter sp.]